MTTITTGNWSRSMSYRCKCNWCGFCVKRGELICQFDNQCEFNNKIRQLISPKICEKGIPIGIRLLIASYYSNNIGPGTYCEDCADFNIKISSSGRVIRQPIRLENERFITGSGVSGCDQYDRGFDGNEKDTVFENNTSNLKNFVVDDEEEIILNEQNDEIEEASDNVSDWSETDEEEMSDWD